MRRGQRKIITPGEDEAKGETRGEWEKGARELFSLRRKNHSLALSYLMRRGIMFLSSVDLLHCFRYLV
jgi:hypothetical protein